MSTDDEPRGTGENMHVQFAFICDYAQVSRKIHALGIGFDTIYARQVPARHPLFHLVAQIRAHVTEAGQKRLALHLIDADGKDVIPPVTGSVNIPPPESGTESLGRINVGLRDVHFPQYGEYSLHLVIDGHEMVRVPLKVAPPPATSPSTQAGASP